MKKGNIRLLAAAIAVMTAAVAFAGCGKKESNGENSTSGLLTLAGSTALQPLADKTGKAFADKYPDAVISVQGGGSGTGLNLVIEGSVDIGNSDVPAEKKLDKELADKLVDHKVCGIGFSIVTNKDVNVESLTSQQIQDIFTGKITNWNEVGGQDLKIEVIHRAKSSGTRAAFKSTIMGGIDENDGIGIMQDSNGNVEKSLESTKGAVSYLALSYLTEDVKTKIRTVNIEGVEASNENIAAGTYHFWAYEHMYTKGEATGLAKTFIEYMMSEENNALIEQLGYIPASDLK